MNYYLSRNYKDTNSAGNKAKTDIEKIMQGIGFGNAGLKQTQYRNSIISFLVTLAGVLKTPFTLKKGDILLLQYPLKKYFSFVCKMAHLRGAKVIVIIHDLGSFRRKKLTEAQEIKRLNNADCIIAHNDTMREWLRQRGCKAELLTLEIFDYLSAQSSPAGKEAEKPFGVLYAGGLSKRKSTFLYEWGGHATSYKINLYGGGFEHEAAEGRERINYMGYVASDKLIATAKGDFGLVWDGFSIDGCTGNWGEYLQYNNPHKTSLYIRCGLPIIIWRKAALAKFVEREGIGFCIDSLKEIDALLAQTTIEEYTQMKQRVERISDRLAGGYYASKAVKEAVKLIGKR